MRALAILSLITLTLVACATGPSGSEQFKADLEAGRCNEARAKADRLDNRGRIATSYAIIYAMCDRDDAAAKRFLVLGARYGEPVAKEALAKLNIPIPPSDLAGHSVIGSSSPSLVDAFLKGFLGAQARQESTPNASPRYVIPEVRPTVEVQKTKPATATSPTYRGTSGLGYQYDLSKPSDQIRYETDINAQIRDSLDARPQRDIDKYMGQSGGGVLR